jgi:hypothetical protein
VGTLQLTESLFFSFISAHENIKIAYFRGFEKKNIPAALTAPNGTRLKIHVENVSQEVSVY